MYYKDDFLKLTPEEKWERLTFANNFIFYKVLHDNPDICRELLEILLQIKIESIEIHNEDSIFTDYGSKGIRLDVYAKNRSQAFDIEMQTYDSVELPERARYYQSVMDVDSLKSGQKYSELKDSYVIFICTKDIFEKGLPLYTFENICRENTEIALGDRAFKLFFISDNCDKIRDEKQKSFLKFVAQGNTSDDFTTKINVLTKQAKMNIQTKRQYMDWERQRTYDIEYGEKKGFAIGLAEGREAGLSQGAHENATRNAQNFLKEGDSPEKVARCVGLPLEEVIALQKQISL